MGLDANGTKFLLYAARRHGVDFARTATLGRQSLLASDEQLEENFRLAGVRATGDELARIGGVPGRYSEEFLQKLGASAVTSFDASAYEGASVVHDMNRPIGDEHKGKFACVLDGGTLEHVFNYPAALKNALEMVELGGHFLAITPTNNFLGHGFYQFSPELFFNVLDEPNGYELLDLIFFEDVPGAAWHKVANPRSVRGRVTLVNTRPAYLLVVAKRTAVKEIFREFPTQSDYAAAWDPSGGDANAAAGAPSLAGRIVRRIKRTIRGPQPDPALFRAFDPFAE